MLTMSSPTVISERRSGQIVDRAAIVFRVDDGDGFEARRARYCATVMSPTFSSAGRKVLSVTGFAILPMRMMLDGHLEDLAVQRFVEMARLQEVGDAVEGVVVDEDGAQQRLFRLNVVRRISTGHAIHTRPQGQTARWRNPVDANRNDSTRVTTGTKREKSIRRRFTKKVSSTVKG
jgi:hypothetical protein